jgi:hypothetical protein
MTVSGDGCSLGNELVVVVVPSPVLANAGRVHDVRPCPELFEKSENIEAFLSRTPLKLSLVCDDVEL